MVACVIGPTDGLTRLCSSPRPPPLPLWNVSRAEYIELSRDVHDAYVESSIAQAKSIEPPSPVGNGWFACHSVRLARVPPSSETDTPRLAGHNAHNALGIIGSVAEF